MVDIQSLSTLQIFLKFINPPSLWFFFTYFECRRIARLSSGVLYKVCNIFVDAMENIVSPYLCSVIPFIPQFAFFPGSYYILSCNFITLTKEKLAMIKNLIRCSYFLYLFLFFTVPLSALVEISSPASITVDIFPTRIILANWPAWVSILASPE